MVYFPARTVKGLRTAIDNIVTNGWVVANKDVDLDWNLDSFASITRHNKLQSLETVSLTAPVVYLDQLFQQLLFSTGNSLTTIQDQLIFLVQPNGS
jgi:hypothetical protein